MKGGSRALWDVTLAPRGDVALFPLGYSMGTGNPKNDFIGFIQGP